ncbi:MAG: hypothetical protein M5R36_22435 [Deltaproteobacteria bacterium]|nr:hypothetical protein [Deltaproteobacteria bacterium]
MRRVVTILLGAALLLSGCAGLDQRPSVSVDATKELFNAAKYSGAIVKSPYEYHAAEIYLNQALQEYDKGHNSVGDAYLLKANEFATQAYKNAKKFRKIDLK